MPLTPEEEKRVKRVIEAGALLALAGLALKHEKIIGDKIRRASIWEASQSVVLDIIDEGKDKIRRLAATVKLNASGDLESVELPAGIECPDDEIAEFEDTFIGDDVDRVSR